MQTLRMRGRFNTRVGLYGATAGRGDGGAPEVSAIYIIASTRTVGSAQVYIQTNTTTLKI